MTSTEDLKVQNEPVLIWLRLSAIDVVDIAIFEGNKTVQFIISLNRIKTYCSGERTPSGLNITQCMISSYELSNRACSTFQFVPIATIACYSGLFSAI